jgi:acid phosphatase class B
MLNVVGSREEWELYIVTDGVMVGKSNVKSGSFTYLKKMNAWSKMQKQYKKFKTAGSPEQNAILLQLLHDFKAHTFPFHVVF